MRNDDSRQQRATTTTTKGSGRKHYGPPRLTVYGDLRRLTRAKGGTKGDSGTNTRV